MNTDMFLVELLRGGWTGVAWCINVRGGCAHASTLPHREWLSLSMYKRDTYSEYILLFLLKEKDIRER